MSATAWRTALVVTMSTVAAVMAQESPQEGPTFRTRTDAVVVDVVVRGRDRQPVRDLTADDFEVFENGVRQQIHSFEEREYWGSGGPERHSGTQRSAASDDGPLRTELPGSAADTTPPVVAIVFDRLSEQARGIAHRAAREFVGTGSSAPALMAVYALNVELDLIQSFTTNAGQLRRAIDNVGGLSWPPRDARTASDEVDARATADESAYLADVPLLVDLQLRGDRRSTFTTDAVMSVVRRLERVPGRKTLVLLTEDVEAFAPDALRAELQSVITVANRANVAIYPMDAGGLKAHTTFIAAREALGQYLGAGDGGSFEQIQRAVAQVPDATMGRLARDTGGVFLQDTNDLSRGFSRVAQDMANQYVLSYTSTGPAYDGRYRRITVKVRRPRVSVVARRGYYATPPGDTTITRPWEVNALARLDRPPLPNDFPIYLAPLVYPSARALADVPLLVQADTRHLTFERGDQRLRAEAVMTLRVREATGRVLAHTSDRYVVDVAPEELADAQARTLLLYRQLRLPPGVYVIEAVVVDEVSEAASVRVASLEVPGVPPTAPSLSSVFVVQHAARGLGERYGSASPLWHDGVLLYPNAGRPVSRADTSGATFAFTLEPGQSELQSVRVEVRRDDRLVADAPVTLAAPDTAGRIQYVGALPAARFAPGRYELRVVASTSSLEVHRTTQFTVMP